LELELELELNPSNSCPLSFPTHVPSPFQGEG
jgi:hypothetical protein